MKYIKLLNIFVVSSFICFWPFYSSAEGCSSVFEDVLVKVPAIVDKSKESEVNKPLNQKVNSHQYNTKYKNMGGLTLLADEHFKGSMTKAYQEAVKVFTPNQLHQLGWKYFIGNTAEFRYLTESFKEQKDVHPLIGVMFDNIQSRYTVKNKYKTYEYQKVIDKYFDGDPIKAFINVFAILDTKSFIRARWRPTFSYIMYVEKSNKLINAKVIKYWLEKGKCACGLHGVPAAFQYREEGKLIYGHVSNTIFGGDMLKTFVHILPVVQSFNKEFNEKIPIWKYPFIGNTNEMGLLANRIKGKTGEDNIWDYKNEEGFVRCANKWFNGDQYKTYVNVYNAMNDNLISFYKLRWPEPQNIPLNVLVLLYDSFLFPAPTTSSTINNSTRDDINVIHTNFMAYSNEVKDSFNELLKPPEPFYRRLIRW